MHLLCGGASVCCIKVFDDLFISVKFYYLNIFRMNVFNLHFNKDQIFPTRAVIIIYLIKNTCQFFK